MSVALPGFAPYGKVIYIVFDELSISVSTPGYSFNESEVIYISGLAGSGRGDGVGVLEQPRWQDTAVISITAIVKNLCIVYKIKNLGA